MPKFSDSNPEEKKNAEKMTPLVTFEDHVKSGISLAVHQQNNYNAAEPFIRAGMYKTLKMELYPIAKDDPAFSITMNVFSTAASCGAPRLIAYRMAMYAYHLWYGDYGTPEGGDREHHIFESTKELADLLAPLYREIEDEES